MRRMGMPVPHPADSLTQNEVDGIKNCPTPLTATNPVMSKSDMLWETSSGKTQNKPTTQPVKISYTGTSGTITTFEVDDTHNNINLKVANDGITVSPSFTSDGASKLGTGSNYVSISSSGEVSFNGTAYINKPITYIEKIAVSTSSVQSTNNIPAGSTILSIIINVITPYTAGGTLQIGKLGTLNDLIDTTDINITETNVHEFSMLQLWTNSEKVYVAVGGTPTDGAMDIYLEYY